MAGNFSVGVMIGGMIGSSFMSAVSGTRRSLDSLSVTSRRLQERQNSLGRAMERYGQLGTRGMSRLNRELESVRRNLERVERQHRRLSAAQATSDALKSNRMALYGQGAEAVALAGAVAAPVISSVRQYAQFESAVRDISITGDLDSKQEQQIATAIRQASLRTNQLQTEMVKGVGQLVADGMAPEKAAGFAEMLGKTATATGADMQDLAKMTYAFSDALKISGAQELEKAFGVAATGAKTGSFEMKDMAKALPGLAKAFAARGIYGQEAITQIVASLEVAKGSGSAEEAVTNMTNWLAAMGRGDTIRKYAKAGIDYQESMQSYVSKGFSQYEASLMIANRFIDDKGKAFVQAWTKAQDSGDLESQTKLMEQFGLSEVFTDIQTVNHLMSMRQGWDRYTDTKKTMTAPESQETLTRDAAKQNDTLEARYRRVLVSLNEMALSIGGSLRPELVSLSDSLLPLLDRAGEWLSANRELVVTVIKVTAGLLASRIAVTGFRLGLNLLVSPFVSVWKGGVLAYTSLVRLRTALAMGGRLRFLVTGIRGLASGAGVLARILSGGLLRGMMMAGRALLWMGRALMLNPVGLAITAIAVAAWLIYRNWETVSGWFKARWNDIRTAFRGGIAGVTRLILEWSPVGLLCGLISSSLKHLGIELPARFSDFGGRLIDGLTAGIRSKWESLKNTVTGMGDSIGGWFKDTLGIHSPSRVFTGFGENIVQGAVTGMENGTPRAAAAGAQLAGALVPPLPVIPSLSVNRPLFQGGPVTSGQSGVLPAEPVTPAAQSSGAVSVLTDALRQVTAGLTEELRQVFRGLRLPPLPVMPPVTVPVMAAVGPAMTPPVPRMPPQTVISAGTTGAHEQGAGGHVPEVRVMFSPSYHVNGRGETPPDGVSRAMNLSLHELEKMLERLLTQKQRRRYD
ncbi:phage tail tape measure protein [Escherichia coli]|uniref:phage tail tape measure protein n=1 Tax=Escherichia coli TaxID=562 RepID=UPI0010DBE1F9|nr:phage tail tape measure protein [Escherichia coli]GDO99323.1 phage minor tail protein [Escherichia coli]